MRRYAPLALCSILSCGPIVRLGAGPDCSACDGGSAGASPAAAPAASAASAAQAELLDDLQRCEQEVATLEKSLEARAAHLRPTARLASRPRAIARLMSGGGGATLSLAAAPDRDGVPALENDECASGPDLVPVKTTPCAPGVDCLDLSASSAFAGNLAAIKSWKEHCSRPSARSRVR